MNEKLGRQNVEEEKKTSISHIKNIIKETSSSIHQKDGILKQNTEII